ncbi:unnamed protein product [Adineta ricciae]|uniref:Uncharacterized protein n=1 Tax=Adineta ricciae TaxID=249248 RepID=A0A814H310_ADIRI|nr:unnamed protein product [Adineta ricciae]
MSKVLQRMKGVLNKKSNSRSLPPGSFPNRQGNQAPIGTITKPPSPTDDDDDDDGAGSKGNYNVPLQTQLRDQQNTASPYESAQPGNTSRNPPTNNMNPPRNNDSTTPAAPQRNAPPERNNNPATPAAPPQRNAPPERNNNPATSAAPQRNPPPERNANPATPAAPPQRNAPPERSNNPATPAAPQRNAPPERNNNPATPAAPQRNAPPERNNNPATPAAPQRNPNPTTPAAPPQRNAPPQSNNVSTAPAAPSVPPPPPPYPPVAMNSSNTNTNPTTSAPMNNFFAAMNANPASTNTESHSANFQPGSNSQKPSTNDSNGYMSTQQPTSLPRGATSFGTPQRDEDTVSRLELDYPIENVLIDANIPSVIARKINDAVEQDRYGHKYHVHRYTYEPASQNLSHDNQNQYDQYSNNDRYSGRPKHRSGTRHIREIHPNGQNPQYDHLLATSPHEHYPRTSRHHNRHRSYSDIPLSQYVDQLLQTPGSTVIHAQRSDDIQNILAQHLPNNQILPASISYNPFQSNDIALPEPIVYYTAQALPNDPMRIY